MLAGAAFARDEREAGRASRSRSGTTTARRATRSRRRTSSRRSRSCNPNIKINVVSQPADNYFALLQAASISHTAPDLAVQWTGLFDLKYEKFLLNLKPYFSAAETSKINGANYMAPNFNPAKGLLVMPLENQFYIGFYNKALFAKAGRHERRRRTGRSSTPPARS